MNSLSLFVLSNTGNYLSDIWTFDFKKLKYQQMDVVQEYRRTQLNSYAQVLQQPGVDYLSRSNHTSIYYSRNNR